MKLQSQQIQSSKQRIRFNPPTEQERLEAKRQRQLEDIRFYRKRLVQMRRAAIERNIPPLYQQATMRTLPKKLVEILRSRPSHKGMLIWGGVGVGKTWAACAIWRHFLASGKTVKRVVYRELLLDIRAGYAKNVAEKDLFDAFFKADLLIIEDLAATKNTEFAIDCTLFLIDGRMERMKPTLITTNLKPSEIEQVFGERITSRLKTFIVVQMTGQDKRGEQ